MASPILDDEIPFDDAPDHPNAIVWRDEAGKTYTMAEISDAHLRNIVKWLRRKITDQNKRPSSVLATADGLGADASEAIEDHMATTRARLDTFLEEARQRGLVKASPSSDGLSTDPTPQNRYRLDGLTISPDLVALLERTAEPQHATGSPSEQLAALVLSHIRKAMPPQT